MDLRSGREVLLLKMEMMRYDGGFVGRRESVII